MFVLPSLTHVVHLIAGVGFLALVGCKSNTPDCGGISDPTARVECRITQLQPIMSDYGKLELALTEIADPAEHDLVALRLMVQQPSLFPILCPFIRTPAAKERCERLEERPHLSERARRPTGAPTP